MITFSFSLFLLFNADNCKNDSNITKKFSLFNDVLRHTNREKELRPMRST